MLKMERHHTFDDGFPAFCDSDDNSPSLAWLLAVSVPFLAVVVWYVAVKTSTFLKLKKTLDHLNQFAR